MDRIENHIGEAVRKLAPGIDWSTYRAEPGQWNRETIMELVNHTVDPSPDGEPFTMWFFEQATAQLGLDPAAVYAEAARLARGVP